MTLSLITSQPSPVRDASSAPFLDGARRGVLMIQRCPTCGEASLLGGVACPACLGPTEWIPASGDATIFSWAVVHQAAHPALAAEVPYLIATVKLAEGPRLMTRLVDLAPGDVKIGLPVWARFVWFPSGEYLPVFGPKVATEGQVP